MSKEVFIKNCAREDWKPLKASLCDTFISRFFGLMFVRVLDRGEGVMLVNPEGSAINSSIHMFFMRFDIAVIWLSQELRVVDKVIALKWRPLYVPKSSAVYILEIHPDRYNDFYIGETIELQYV